MDCYWLLYDSHRHTHEEREKEREWRREKEREFYIRAWDRAQTELVEMSKKIIYHFLLFVCIPSTASVVACRLRKRNKKYIYFFFDAAAAAANRRMYLFYFIRNRSRYVCMAHGSVHIPSLHTNVVLTIAGEKRTIHWIRHLNVRNVDWQIGAMKTEWSGQEPSSRILNSIRH